eukprot:5405412-Prymnesium_polylepis.1
MVQSVDAAAAADDDDSRPPLDRRRLGLFAAWGAYYGVINYQVFRLISHIRWGGPWRGAVGMTAIDVFVHLPTLFYPQFYFAREVAFATEWPTSTRELREHAESGLSKYRANFVSDIRTLVLVFVPIDMVMFRWLPLHWRTPFLGTVGLVFPLVLSKLRGAQGS